jgi:hypothetical protein
VLLEERLRLHRRLGQAGSGLLIVRVAQSGASAAEVVDVAELAARTTRRWFPVDGGAFTFEFLYAELTEEIPMTATALALAAQPLAIRSFVFDLPVFVDANEIIHGCVDTLRGTRL